MDINAYRYMVALERYKTISATARKLYLTQPALTNYIKRIENELGVPLIERGISPIRFTRFGEIYLKYAKDITDLDKRLIDEIELNKKQTQDIVRIGITAASIHDVVKHLSLFQAKNPDIYVELIEYNSETCEECLSSKNLDLAFFTTPVLDSNLEYTKRSWIPFLFIIPKNLFAGSEYDLGGNSIQTPLEINIDFLQNKPFILTAPATGTSRWLRAFFTEHQIIPGPCINVELLSTGTNLCKAGYGIMILNANSGSIQLIDSHPDVIFCSVKGITLGRWIVMARNKRILHTDAAERFWNWFRLQKDG